MWLVLVLLAAHLLVLWTFFRARTSTWNLFESVGFWIIGSVLAYLSAIAAATLLLLWFSPLRMAMGPVWAAIILAGGGALLLMLWRRGGAAWPWRPWAALGILFGMVVVLYTVIGTLFVLPGYG